MKYKIYLNEKCYCARPFRKFSFKFAINKLEGRSEQLIRAAANIDDAGRVRRSERRLSTWSGGDDKEQEEEGRKEEAGRRRKASTLMANQTSERRRDVEEWTFHGPWGLGRLVESPD